MRRDLTENDFDIIRALFLKGQSILQIANKFDIKQHQLYAWLPRLNAVRDKFVADLLAEGLSPSTIATKIGSGRHLVKEIIRRLRPDGPPSTEEALADLRKGLSLSDVADKFGVPVKLVRSIRNSKVREMCRKGHSCDEIMNMFLLSASTVVKIVSAGGGKVNGVSYGLSGNSRSKYAEMADLYKAGMTYSQIGAKFGVCRERVRQVLRSLLPDMGELKLEILRDRRTRRKELKLRTALNKLIGVYGLATVRDDFSHLIIKDACLKYGISIDVVVGIRELLGVTPRARADGDLVRNLFSDGVSKSEISRRVGRSRIFVYRALRSTEGAAGV